MTVSSQDRKTRQVGDGSVTSFSFGFPVFSVDEISVIITDANGINTKLVQDAAGGFSVSLTGSAPSAGTVTYPIDAAGSVLTSSEHITIIRTVDAEQGLDLTNAGAFRAQSIENALDKLTMLFQQVQEQIDRVLIVPITTANNISMELPAPEAGSMLAWNGSGGGLTNVAADISGLLEAMDSEHFVIDTFSGTGAQTSFTLTTSPGNVACIDVFIDGVRQSSVDSTNTAQYSVTGTTLTFATAPASGTRNVQVKYRLYTSSTTTTPGDGSVTTAKLASGAVTFEKMAGECATAVQTCTAQTLSNTTTSTSLSFSTSLAGSKTPKKFSFLLTCTHASGDAGYSQNNTVVVDQFLFMDSTLSGGGTSYYGFVIQSPSATGFSIRTAKNGLAIPHKTTGELTQMTASRWTITPSVIGW